MIMTVARTSPTGENHIPFPTTHDTMEERLAAPDQAPASTPKSTSKPLAMPRILARFRKSSANLVQTNLNTYSSSPSVIQPTLPRGMTVSALKVNSDAAHRISMMSVTSATSCESVPESADEESYANGIKIPSAQHDSSNPGSPLSSSSPAVQFSTVAVPRPRTRHYSMQHRYSLPVHTHSFSALKGSSNSNPSRNGVERSASIVPLRKHREDPLREEEKQKRKIRRWKVALELRDTERTYARLLKDVNQEYYQPLLNALPRSEKRSASTSPQVESENLSYFSFPLYSFTTSGTSVPVLDRKIIREIFSNFEEVLSLSNVILEVLEKHIPDMPSEAVPTPSLATPCEDSSLSHSADSVDSTDTLDSTGPHTPEPNITAWTSDKQTNYESRSRTSSPIPDVRRRQASGPIPPPINLGGSLLSVIPYLKCYAFFIANFSTCLLRLASLQESSGLGIGDSDKSPWSKFEQTRNIGDDSSMSRTNSAGKSKLGLGALLLNIVQRVPRYRLLLADLLKYTEISHPDWRDLKKCFDLVDSAAEHSESQISVHLNSHKILDLQQRFFGLDEPLLSPGRQLLKIGPIRKLDRRGNEQVRTLMLFNDILVIALLVSGAEEKGDSNSGKAYYRFHRRINLLDVTVIGKEEDHVNSKFGIEVLTPNKSFAMFTDTSKTKADWLKSIREAASELVKGIGTLQRDEVEEPRTKERILSIRTASTRPSLDAIPGTPYSEKPNPFDNNTPTIVTSPVEMTPTNNRSWSDLMRIRTRTQSNDKINSFVFPPPPLGTRQSSTEIECRLLENYSAPVWVPDSKADRCMKCQEGFGVWRRRHHCRICGSVVCWACSTKTFVIPGTEDSGNDRLARACDTCFTSIFGTAPDPSLHQPSRQPGIHRGGTHLSLETNPLPPDPDDPTCNELDAMPTSPLIDNEDFDEYLDPVPTAISQLNYVLRR